MSINKKAQRIDLDTEDNIYHLKVTSLGARWWLGPLPGRVTGVHKRGGPGLRICLSPSVTRREFPSYLVANGKPPCSLLWEQAQG